jgi:hypothetical protein
VSIIYYIYKHFLINAWAFSGQSAISYKKSWEYNVNKLKFWIQFSYENRHTPSPHLKNHMSWRKTNFRSGISGSNFLYTVLDEFSLYPSVFHRILFMKYLYEVSCIWYKLHTVKRQYLCVRLTNAAESKSVSTNKELYQFYIFHVLCTVHIYEIFKKTNKCTWMCGYKFIIW